MGGWGGGCSQWAGSRWRKTEQRSQRSAGGDSGSVGRPQRHVLSGCGMTAQAQLVSEAGAAAGRSEQVIKPFMHSSTHPQAFYANSLGKVTTVYRCFCRTLIALIPPPCSPSSFLPSSASNAFLSSSLILSYISPISSPFSLHIRTLLTHSLVRTLTHST